ncbi:hypothetical protein ACQP1K_24020 [Sphaerimonospora sp. CA-214678]|uniref:hypothetical protein n=1 Tax=Sphaerimonospora sp. CA-214678 TaxID=3240029 RepID=UPI003D8E221A
MPLLLIVDPEAEPKMISVHTDPSEDGYRTVTRVKSGEKPHIPAPVDFILDTSVFLDA